MKKALHFISRAVSLLSLNLGRKVYIGDARYRAAGVHPNRLRFQGNYEPWLDNAYRAALSLKEGAFIDVGANLGQTLIKILAIDKERQYLGFEPQMDCCFYMDQFIKQNHLRNHVLLPIGLSDRAAALKLLKRRSDADDTASTIENFRPEDFYTETQIIYVTKGDDILNDLQLTKVSAVKIDVEGGELEVIRGLEGILRKYMPYVFFEVLNHFIVATNQQIDPETIGYRERRNHQLEEVLRKIGFRIFNILPGDQLVEVEKIKPIVSSDLRLTNYVAVHGHEADLFLIGYREIVEGKRVEVKM